MEANFYYDEDLIGIKDSLELDSGQIVAELEFDDLLVRLLTAGDVRVVFNDDVFKTPSQFPDELKELIRNGKLYDDKRVYVDMSNWFELRLFYKMEDEDGYDWTGWADVVDGDEEWKSAGDIFDTLMDYANEYEKSIQD